MTTSELVKIIIGSSVVTTVFLSLVSLIAKTWIVERIKLIMQKEHTQFITDLQWEVKVKERAERVAEYISLARSLKEDSSEDDYRKANKLSWEMAMWLPDDIYIQMVQAITNPNIKNNELTVVIAVRKLLLKENAGSLNPDHVAHHAPGIGRRT